jgi:hypothetical protein
MASDSREEIIAAHLSSIPSTPIIWPANNHQSNQIQQTKGSAKPQASFVLPTVQPNQSSVQPRTTPAHVSNVRAVTRNVGGQKNITVQFAHPSGDPYFSGAKVYLKKSGQQPVLVASGTQSPLTFTATNDAAPHSIFVTSVGNWGETDVSTSPSVPVRLFGPTIVAKGTGTPVASGGGGSPTLPPTGVSDGLIHGDSIWVVDPAVVWWRDDFNPVDQITYASGNVIYSQQPWFWLSTSALPLTPRNQGSLYSGELFTANSGTANGFGLLLPGNNHASNSITTANALFEHPNWKMEWNFSVNRGAIYTSSITTPAFSFAQTSFYLGLAHFPALAGTATTPRPPVFVGLRFDTDTTAPSIGDTQFVFEAVCNTASLGVTTRTNTQGNTSLTGIVPTEGHFYRLEILCTVAGSVKLTLIDSVLVAGVDAPVANFSATLTIPIVTYTSLQYVATNGMATMTVNSIGFMPYSEGSQVSIAGTSQLGIDGTQTIVALTAPAGAGSDWINFFDTTAVGLSTKTGATLTGLPAVYPWWSFGNDTSASPTTLTKAISLDYIAFVWNPGVGGGTGTPNPLKARYF